ncbi:gluzincin family metallopeptidase [Angustibacter luteus]|uniref:Peptidase MA-like domain-containing protein n=1 Tax=Angustibacter luteus TaxID=658456 RepID=A0ABW1JAS3_9ACTN
MSEPRGWPTRRGAPVVSLLAALVAAVVVVGLVIGFGTAWWPRGGSARPAPAATATSSPTADEDQQQVDALRGLLDTRVGALTHRDRARWLSTVDPEAAAFRARQAAVFDNLSAVPLASWTYQYLNRAPELSAQRATRLGGHPWVARVEAGYRLRGFDTTTSTAEQYLTMVQRDGHWYVAADTDGGTAPQPWDLGPVHVARGDRVLVLGTASPSTLRSYAAAGDRAVGRVSEVWGRDWSRRAVLVVPRTQAEFGKLLLRESKGLSQVAAVTTGALGSPGSSAPDAADGRAGNDRVVLNPGAFARLSSTGQRVVLTHEMTHVAVRQTTSASVPTWLAEGFADYVGYRGTGVTARGAAGDVLVLVRSGHGPTALPTADDFDPTRTTIAPSYSASWLACLRIADEYGQDELVDLYRRAAGSRSPDSDPQEQLSAAFPKALGVSESAFVQDWRRYLGRLADQ